MIAFTKLDRDDVRLIQSGLNRFLPDRKPLKVDGYAGSNTQKAYAAYRTGLERKTAPRPKTEFDSRTEKNLSTLLPKVQPLFRQFVREARELVSRQGLTLKILSGNRTWQEQDALYAQGRTKPGPKVTNARAGYSNHNFGVAIDGGMFRGRTYLDGGTPAEQREARRAYADIATIAKRLGLEWGGDWRSIKDPPHFQYPTGYSMAKMRELAAAGQAIV